MARQRRERGSRNLLGGEAWPQIIGAADWMARELIPTVASGDWKSRYGRTVKAGMIVSPRDNEREVDVYVAPIEGFTDEAVQRLKKYGWCATPKRIAVEGGGDG